VAKRLFKEAYLKIMGDSYQGAARVRDGILEAVDQIPKNPYRYPADKFKYNNTGNYRAFELYSYRFAYKLTDENIQILRVRHIKREPLNY
jgi:plasmid stabilization system protein ParE